MVGVVARSESGHDRMVRRSGQDVAYAELLGMHICFSVATMANDSQVSDLKQHPFIIPQFLWALHPGRHVQVHQAWCTARALQRELQSRAQAPLASCAPIHSCVPSPGAPSSGQDLLSGERGKL